MIEPTTPPAHLLGMALALAAPAARLLARPRPGRLGGRHRLSGIVTMASAGMIVTDRDEALKAGGGATRLHRRRRLRLPLSSPRCSASAPAACHTLALKGFPAGFLALRQLSRPPLPPLPTTQIAIGAKTVAVLGIKTENHAGQPAFFVPEYLQSVGCRIIPVPGGCAAARRAFGSLVARWRACSTWPAAQLAAGAPRAASALTILVPLAAPARQHCQPLALPLAAAVYYPEVTQILGEPVVRDLKQARAGGGRSCRHTRVPSSLTPGLTCSRCCCCRRYRGHPHHSSSPGARRSAPEHAPIPCPCARRWIATQRAPGLPAPRACTHALPCTPCMLQINEPVDILDVFRRPQDLMAHLEDILAMQPRPACIWLQSGIRWRGRGLAGRGGRCRWPLPALREALESAAQALPRVRARALRWRWLHLPACMHNPAA